jgi:GT2 family glycosyltransferase
MSDITVPSNEYPSVVVVIVNWNNEEDTTPCLDCLSEQTYDNYKVVVVDNGSGESSYERLREAHNWPIYLRNEKNRGFTGGNNPGIQWALDDGADWVLLLNNDTKVEPTFLADLVDAAINLSDNAGIVGPKVHTYDSHKLWAAGGEIDRFTGATEHRLEKCDEPEQVDYVVGAALLARREVFEDIGLLDEDFFIYFEETEFCERARTAGWDVWYVPAEGVYHKESIEFEHSPFRDYYFSRNRYLFQRKTRSTSTLAAFLLYYLIRVGFLQPAYLAVTGNSRAARETLRGVIDAIRGVTGRNH